MDASALDCFGLRLNEKDERKMKIFFAGNFNWHHGEKALADALTKLGHEVIEFDYQKFLQGRWGNCQMALSFPGPALWKLNKVFLQKVRDSKPDIVFVWNGTQILPRTLRLIKTGNVKIGSYCNDDPFSPLTHTNKPWHHHFLWRWYLKCLKNCDINFVYRAINIQEAVSCGAKNVHLLRSYFVPDQHHPVALSALDKEKFACDAVFAGHYEPDGREEYLRALVKAGLHVRLFGGGYWTKKVLGDLTSYFGNVLPVHGGDYVKALCGAKICLSFLSKLNRDTYTRRCFEIPACGRLLMCERTDDLKKMFIEGEEAVFFSSREELVEKALWLMEHPGEIERIAEAGRKRVWADGHDVTSRARQLMDFFAKTNAVK